MTVQETHALLLEQALVEAREVQDALHRMLAVLRTTTMNRKDRDARQLSLLCAQAVRQLMGARVATDLLEKTLGFAQTTDPG